MLRQLRVRRFGEGVCLWTFIVFGGCQPGATRRLAYGKCGVGIYEAES